MSSPARLHKRKVWIAIVASVIAVARCAVVDQVLDGDGEKRNLRSRSQLLSLFRFHDPATVEMKPEKCTYVNSHGSEVMARPSVEPATIAPQVASQELLQQLRYDIDTRRPIWTSGIVAELDRIVASGGSISCSHYPHSAEDVALAVQKLGLNLKQSKVGVVSSLSPWVEHILRSAGASHVVTVDYNEPIVCSGIDWIESKSVAQFSTEVGTYDLLLSFSGIEHSGLGRYGDPINPDADIEAVAQMHRALAPGGYLLLAIPTSTHTNTQVPGNPHRIYGRDRIVQMIEHKFNFLGRVWDGRVFGGWDDVESNPGLFSRSVEVAIWQFQNVLILRKPRN